VSAYYFSAFFAPVHLTADTDWSVLSGLDDPRAWAGLAFVAALGFAIWFCARRQNLKPIAFGLIWFVLALLPTAWMPLAEVANDHRMFFAFIGLAISVVWGLRLVTGPKLTVAVAAIICLVLVAEARATYLRNEVWKTEESLWRDVVEKSPKGPRALMNYGLTLMGRGATQDALIYLERADKLTTNYFFLDINLAIAYGMAGRVAEAEARFHKAEALEPRRYESHFFYGRWLRDQRRIPEAEAQLRSAVESNPSALDARQLWMGVLATQQNWTQLEKVGAETLKLVPGDPETLRLLEEPKKAVQALDGAGKQAEAKNSAEGWLDYSLKLYQAGRYRDCIIAAQKALQLRPGYAEAWNNIAAAYNSLQEWTAGIAAADRALALNPGLELARNNRAWAAAQQKAGVK